MRNFEVLIPYSPSNESYLPFLDKHYANFGFKKPVYHTSDMVLYCLFRLFITMFEDIEETWDYFDYIHFLPIDGPMGKYYIFDNNYASFKLSIYDVYIIFFILVQPTIRSYSALQKSNNLSCPTFFR